MFVVSLPLGVCTLILACSMHTRHGHRNSLSGCISPRLRAISSYVHKTIAREGNRPDFAQGSMGNIGMYASGIPLGYMIDHRGPRPGIMIGCIALGAGFYPIKIAYDGGVGSMSVFALCFFSFLTGFGSCSAFQAAIKTGRHLDVWQWAQTTLIYTSCLELAVTSWDSHRFPPRCLRLVCCLLHHSLTHLPR